MRDYADALIDIIRSMTLALDFTADMEFSDYQKDEKSQFAVIRCLEIVGEASKRLPEDFRSANPDIPWKAMAGMRDRLIHGYDAVDTELVWRTVRQTLPSILEKLK